MATPEEERIANAYQQSFDFIKDDETREETIAVLNLFFDNPLLSDWISEYTPYTDDAATQVFVAELADDRGIDSSSMGGSIKRVAIVAKYGYEELKRRWNYVNTY